tara:strand:- start:3545 stop:5170 length:1626 start_codon:yes stop_codon:yes gene_type:complete
MATLLSTLIGAGGASGSGTDNREYKNFQDWYGYYAGGQSNGYNFATPQSTRDPGNTSGGTGTGAQNRRAVDNSTFTWEVPTGVSKVRITCLGGGGGAGHYRSHYYGDSGGSGGGFGSGEFNVTAGEVLDIFVGRGGWGRYQDSGWGGSGQTTSVQASSANGGSGHLNVQAGGGGRGYHSSNVDPPGSSTVNGSDLISGTNMAYTGGRGGYGSQTGFGWGPEGYPSGGGGSCASYKGNGYRGGNGDNGGYGYGGAGGGGIGGEGGNTSGNNSPSNVEFWGAGGGGSAGQGTNGYPSGGGSSYNPKGGAGASWVSADGGGGYTGQGMKSVEGNNDSSNMYNGYNNANWYYYGSGSRYGDGVGSSYSGGGGGGGGGGSQYEQGFGGSSGGGGGTTYPNAKTFNGVLGRLFGGGGCGGPRSSANFGGQAHTAGNGGAGAGGGGCGVETNNGQNDYSNMNNYCTFSTVDLAWYVNDNQIDQNHYRLNGNGGHGGALGGGGGGNSQHGSMGGNGGIGAGGGGAIGHYSPSSNGQSGAGGPGYVLIEW